MIVRDNMAAESRESKTQLSKNLLGMKFMQRSAARKEFEKNELSQQRIIDDEHWVLDMPALEHDESQYVIEPSYAKLNSLQFGRQSYQKFNPEIEKLMQNNNAKKDLDEAEQREKEISISDDEMTGRYSSLIGTISKKFAKKRHQSDGKINTMKNEEGVVLAKKMKKKHKKQFMKPSDD